MFRNTCSGITSDIFSTPSLGKTPSKTKRSKAHPLGKKADRSSDLNKWDMKFRPVGIMNIV
eukprot:509293-Heterocapsa_arctica.AAC.1